MTPLTSFLASHREVECGGRGTGRPGFLLCVLLFFVAQVGFGGEFFMGPSPTGSDYIVAYEDSFQSLAREKRWSGRRQAEEIATPYGALFVATLDRVLGGAVMRMEEVQARQMAADWRVRYVLQDQAVTLQQGAAMRRAPVWGLDRIDERSWPLNNHFVQSEAGVGVNIYIVDSGVLEDAAEFGQRLKLTYSTDRDAEGRPIWGDPQMHGTLVARLAGGSSSGVANGATIHAIRIRTAVCAGGGPGHGPPPLTGNGGGGCLSFAALAEALEWLVDHGQSPAILNLSLGYLPLLGIPDPVEDALVLLADAGTGPGKRG